MLVDIFCSCDLCSNTAVENFLPFFPSYHQLVSSKALKAATPVHKLVSKTKISYQSSILHQKYQIYTLFSLASTLTSSKTCLCSITQISILQPSLVVFPVFSFDEQDVHISLPHVQAIIFHCRHHWSLPLSHSLSLPMLILQTSSIDGQCVFIILLQISYKYLYYSMYLCSPSVIL